jgi:hypothetical protein
LDVEARPRADNRPEIARVLENTGRNRRSLGGVGIVVTNLSLYPVRIAGLAFLMGGKTILVFDRDEHKDEWPLKLASHARMRVFASDREWKRLETLGVPNKIMDWKFVAVAATETGARLIQSA